ncbi:MAG: hydroxysqualene dehydroxylase HpnE [Acidimicrobiales bacterium]
MKRPLVAVVGGGLAGITAALGCADGGAAVVLLERRRRLGGLTWSFEHDGRWIDNGQHVFLRCCEAYRGFLERIGSAGDVVLQDRLDIPVVSPAATPGGPPLVGRLRRVGAPAPLHLAPALMRYPHLSVADRLRLGPAVVALRRLRLDDPALDEETFGSWLGRHGQRPAAIRGLWDLITRPTVNLPAAEASLAMAAKVFKTGLLEQAGAADIGWSALPLGVLHGERSAGALGRAGAEVRLGAAVERVSQAKGPAGRWSVAVGGDNIDADAVVVAVPHQAVNQVLPPASFATQAQIEHLGQSAVVDVQLLYDRPVTTEPLLAGVGSPIQWVFDRSGPGDAGRQYLAVSLSGADDLLGRHPDDLAREVEAELPRLLPGAREARVLDRLVTKERAATFRAAPGQARLRPRTETRFPGLFLAGAWTDTGWPATMEGAVLSGQAAAHAALTAIREPAASAPAPEEVA